MADFFFFFLLGVVYVEQRESCVVMSWRGQNALFTPAHTDCFHTQMKTRVHCCKSRPLAWVVGGLGEQTPTLPNTHRCTRSSEDLLSSNVLHQNCCVFSFTSFYHVCFDKWDNATRTVTKYLASSRRNNSQQSQHRTATYKRISECFVVFK